jgi:hypothetical protein
VDTKTERAQHALHVRYGDATYDVRKLSRYFATVEDAWLIVYTLAICRIEEAPSALAITHRGFEDDDVEVPATSGSADDPIDVVHLMDALRASFRHTQVRRDLQQPLIVKYLHLNSPLEITLAAAGSTGVTIYALYLLSAVLRDPERIGSWLPRLTAGWHNGWREAETARLSRRNELKMIRLIVDDQVLRLLALSEDLANLKAVDVSVLGDSDTPEDIAEVLESD